MPKTYKNFRPNCPPDPRGTLDLEHYDRAMLAHMGAAFLPFPNPDMQKKLRRPMQQVQIPEIGTLEEAFRPSNVVRGVEGPGFRDPTAVNPGIGRVIVVWDTPEDIYNRYLLPGIRIKRDPDVSYDDQRRHAQFSGRKYRVPAPDAQPIEINGQQGFTKYVERRFPEPVTISYEIEVRARYQRTALAMRRFIRRKFKDRSPICVLDTNEQPSTFEMFREGDSETSELIGSINRHHGYILSYRIEAEIDDYDEIERVPLTQGVDLRAHLITSENGEG